MTYEDELREEHEHELDRREMDHALDAITYSERENANLHRAVEQLTRENKKLVEALEKIDKVWLGTTGRRGETMEYIQARFINALGAAIIESRQALRR